MDIGSPRILSTPEVTDTQSVFNQAQKPTKAAFVQQSPRWGQPCAPQLITSHHREQERESMKTKEEHFKVSKRSSLMGTIKTKTCVERRKKVTLKCLFAPMCTSRRTCVTHDSLEQYVMFNMKHGLPPRPSGNCVIFFSLDTAPI